MPSDINRILELIPLAVGALKPGSPESAALLRGYQQSQQRMRQESLQGRQFQRQDELTQAQIQNLQQDNARSDAQLALQRLSAYGTQDQRFTQALEQHPEMTLPPDTDPLQAQNALTVSRLGSQQQLGVPAGTPQGPLPNMPQLIKRATQIRAQKLMDAFDKKYGDQAQEAETSTTLHAGEFAGMTIQQIRALTEAPIAPPPPKGRPAVAPGSFEDYITTTYGPKPTPDQILEGRKAYQQVDDQTKRPPILPRDRFSVQPVTNKDGSTSLIRVDLDTNTATPIALPASVAGPGRPTSTEQIGVGYLLRTQASDVIAKGFETQLSGLGRQFGTRLPTLLASSEGQRYRQAQDEFINAALRRESGAAIQPSEYDRFQKIYFVVPGDSPETIAQKQAARQRVIDGFKTGAGNLGRDVSPAEPASGNFRIVGSRPAPRP